MIQQVNLYQDILNNNQTKPAVDNYLYGIALIISLLLGFSIYLLVSLNNTKNDLQETQQQFSSVEIDIELLRSQFPEQQVDPLITQEISRLQNILTSLSHVVDLLSDNKSDQTQGFSRYFSALAKQSISDVWLSQIDINAEQNSLTLKGSTFNTEKIPVFLQRLHHEPIFKGRHFAKLSMTQPKESDQQVDFTISTISGQSEQEKANE